MEKKKTKRPLNKGNFSKERQPENTGRKLAEIDEEKFIQMASEDFTMAECAATLGVCVDTLYHRFSDLLNKGRLIGNGSIKRQLFRKAMGGDLGALIWLSKNRKGIDYRDRPADDVGNVNLNVYIDEVPK